MIERAFIVCILLITSLFSCKAKDHNENENNNYIYPVNTRGGPMILIPEGEFLMGNNFMNENEIPGWVVEKENILSIVEDEKPAHKVYLDSYYIDVHEITNAEWEECFDAGVCPKFMNRWQVLKKMVTDGDTQIFEQYQSFKATYKGLLSPDQPAVGMSWSEAEAYCQWAGKRLPTEAEWEKAARGTDARIFPWGNEFKCGTANYCDASCMHDSWPKLCDDKYPKSSPAGSFPEGKSPYGVLDMAGNVMEWVSDWYDPEYYKKSPYKNPVNTTISDEKVSRGASWISPRDALTTTTRETPPLNYSAHNIGFRCARDAE